VFEFQNQLKDKKLTLKQLILVSGELIKN